MEDFKNLKRVAMSELRKLDAQYANKEEFSESDAKLICNSLFAVIPTPCK